MHGRTFRIPGLLAPRSYLIRKIMETLTHFEPNVVEPILLKDAILHMFTLFQTGVIDLDYAEKLFAFWSYGGQFGITHDNYLVIVLEQEPDDLTADFLES